MNYAGGREAGPPTYAFTERVIASLGIAQNSADCSPQSRLFCSTLQSPDFINNGGKNYVP